MAEIAKIDVFSPCSKATAVESAVTAAECELGIPPVLVMSDQSSRLEMIN